MDAELSPIAIADDGELEDVRRLLEKLELPFVEAWSGEADPGSLRISNARRALEPIPGARPQDGQGRQFHIVILDEAHTSMRHDLSAGTFDFVVQRPVHPAALRLLILHALYSGPEKRCHPRVAMGAEVKLKPGLIGRSATLTQLSEKGCGLISEQHLEVGARATVVLPPSLTAAGSLSLEGRVVSSKPLEEALADSHEISIAFRPPNAATRQRLRSVMASHGVGSASLRPRLQEAAPAGPARSAPEPKAAGSPSERRRAPRKRYRRPVLASAKGAVHTLIGRDLSTGGMRVSADAGLDEGDEFKLVIYGAGGHAPLVVKAVVTRIDGEGGCALQFRDLGTSAAATLEEMVRCLPQLGRDASRANVVVTEILEDA